MCPACIAASTWLVAGAATAATSLGAFALSKLRHRDEAEDFQLRMQPDDLRLEGGES
jgi:hypothetical protein